MESMNTITIERAEPRYLPVVLDLIARVGLPLDGVEHHFPNFHVALDQGLVIACAGIERYGDLALLRSVAVHPEVQRGGVGSTVVDAVLADAHQQGIQEVVLLTTTAKDFFLRKHGFELTDRRSYESRLAQSPEWTLPRCSSAVVLRKLL
jgi:amino-acid N-acetyltransferase